MSKRESVPTYRRHKQSGQALVTLTDGLGGRRDVLLGKYGTRASRTEYARVIAEWEANSRRPPVPITSAADLTVNEVMLAYWRFAEGYYRKNGEPTTQLDRVKRSLKLAGEGTVRPHPGPRLRSPGPQGGPPEDGEGRLDPRLRSNSCIGCIKRAFKWGVENLNWCSLRCTRDFSPWPA